MEPNTRPLQDGTPAEPGPDPEAVWEQIDAALRARWLTGGPVAPEGERNRRRLERLAVDPELVFEPEAGQ